MRSTSGVKLTILGSRGSYPIDGAAYQKFGGSTACLMLVCGDRTLFFDAGSGLSRFRSVQHLAPSNDYHILLTHLHFDHIIGITSFPPLYAEEAHVSFYGPLSYGIAPSSIEIEIEDAIAAICKPPFHPLSLWETRSQKTFNSLRDGSRISFYKGSLEPVISAPPHLEPDPKAECIVDCYKNYTHPKCGVFIFAITLQGKRIIYATDVEGRIDTDPRVAMAAKGADLLIHDATYTAAEYYSKTRPTRGYGHSTVEMAAKTARRLHVQNLLLFHHSPTADDRAVRTNLKVARRIFPATDAAAAGVTYSL